MVQEFMDAALFVTCIGGVLALDFWHTVRTEKRATQEMRRHLGECEGLAQEEQGRFKPEAHS